MTITQLMTAYCTCFSEVVSRREREQRGTMTIMIPHAGATPPSLLAAYLRSSSPRSHPASISPGQSIYR